MIKKLLLCLGCLGLLAVPGVNLAWGQSDVRADRYGAIVVEAKTGKILLAEHADRMLHPASLTKLMTLYMTFAALRAGKLDENSPLDVSAYAANASPTKLGLRGGDTISVRNAVLGVITRSANDAARVLAENIGGNETRFAAMMTEQAHRLGMVNTTFQNASGLPNPGQISTPKDMAILARAIITHFPEYYNLFSTQSFEYRGRIFGNHNHLMERYPGMDGMKTGYVAASGFNLVSSAVQNGTRLIGVVYGGKTAALRDDYMAGLLDRSFEMARNDTAHESPRYAGTVMQPTRVNIEPPISPPENPAAPVAEKDAPTPPPTAEDKAVEGHWGVQIGAFRSRRDAQRALQHAKTNYRDLHDASFVIAPTRTARGRFYRAQLLGISESAAASACSALTAHGHSCMTVRQAG